MTGKHLLFLLEIHWFKTSLIYKITTKSFSKFTTSIWHEKLALALKYSEFILLQFQVGNIPIQQSSQKKLYSRNYKKLIFKRKIREIDSEYEKKKNKKINKKRRFKNEVYITKKRRL